MLLIILLVYLLYTYIKHNLNYGLTELASSIVSQMEDCLSLKFCCEPVNCNKLTVDTFHLIYDTYRLSKFVQLNFGMCVKKLEYTDLNKNSNQIKTCTKYKIFSNYYSIQFYWIIPHLQDTQSWTCYTEILR